MVLTAAQTTAFFEDDAQMAMPHATVVQLAEEGINTVYDLVDFDKDTLQQVADNLRKPPGRIQDPNQPNNPQATIPTPGFVFGAKSHKRLLAACELLRYYNTVGRTVTSTNIVWANQVKDFDDQWKALVNRSKEDKPEVPKITKNLTVIKWTEAFEDFLS